MTTSLGCGSAGSPALLLQYTYYLNNQGTKCVTIGLDTITFEPRMIIHSTTQRTGVHLSQVEWTYLHTSYKSVYDFLVCKKDVTFLTAYNFVLKSILTKNKKRFIKLKNNPNPTRQVTLDFAEWVNLGNLTNYLCVLMTKFIEISPFVVEYYNLYLQQSRALKKDPLTSEDYFMPELADRPQFNTYRLFNEIPLVCREKLTNDLYGCRGYSLV